MVAPVKEDLHALALLQRQAIHLPTFDRLVLQLRWADGFSRRETADVLESDVSIIQETEVKLRAWAGSHAHTHALELRTITLA